MTGHGTWTGVTQQGHTGHVCQKRPKLAPCWLRELVKGLWSSRAECGAEPGVSSWGALTLLKRLAWKRWPLARYSFRHLLAPRR